MPRERPILFSGPMVRALLEGRKSQTRRIVNPQPPSPEAVRKLAGDDYHWLAPERHTEHSVHRPVGPVWAVRDLMGCEPGLRSPFGVPGDRLWVRETFAIECNVEDNLPPHNDGRPIRRYNYADGDDRWEQTHYRATDPDPDLCIADAFGDEDCGVRWKPSIHMPRWASRITLRVTSVRVERLQAITEDDARAEGVEPRTDGPLAMTAVQRFTALWNEINGKRAPWSTSPWVWVVGFEREVQP